MAGAVYIDTRKEVETPKGAGVAALSVVRRVTVEYAIPLIDIIRAAGTENALEKTVVINAQTGAVRVVDMESA